MNRWFRRWGWLIALLVLAIVGGAAAFEWRQSRAEAAAELRGEALLSALEIPDQAQRLAALTELPREGAEGVAAALVLADEQLAAGDAEAAVGTLNDVASDGEVPPLYRDLAAFKALMAQGAEADRSALEALAQPGAPFGLLAQERIAVLDLEAGNRDPAIERLRAISADAGVTPGQAGRVEALLTALGVAPEAPAPEAVAEPAGE
ncbi:hypothetical protein FHG71_06325 [Rubellimicrobium roseum]|uniref:Ancillary SecYEG translocon subunit/Cell division coordinator CpoB TPR domain-containing protein n=2 Tax=Rubellimicrobium roseum TaxID=687525 RepID=A0A5C4NK58_9RHOB|nr:hypothetical protein FHG71_06325 [Rubellimicrobium roseum]